MWQRFLKDYFSFSSSDRNGIVLLISLIFLVIILTYLLPRFAFNENEKDISHFKEIASKYYTYNEVLEAVSSYEVVDFFYFDPNQLTRFQMQKLGFNDGLIRNFEKYLSKKGRFREKEDVLKIYGMTDSIYGIIEPFIIISQQEKIHEEPIQSVRIISGGVRIEINSADTVKLKLLPGIGSVLSSRIVRYRELLGGFWQTDQLKEVYGISSELFERINTSVEVDTSLIRKMNINEASFSELIRHPYVSYDLAVEISKFLKQNNKISGPDVLLENNVIDSVTYKRLRPYFEVSH
jgi:competence protein ComEA